MINYNQQYTQTYLNYKSLQTNLETWNDYNRFAKMALINDYLDTSELKLSYSTLFSKDIKSLYSMINKLFSNITEPSLISTLILEKLNECSTLDFTDESKFAYNLFSCSKFKEQASILEQKYNSAIQEYTDAAKLISSSHIVWIKNIYSIFLNNSKALVQSSIDERYLSCKEAVDLASVIPNIEEYVNKSTLAYLDACNAFKNLIESPLAQEKNIIEITKCVNLDLSIPNNILLDHNKCTTSLPIYTDYYNEMYRLADYYNEMYRLADYHKEMCKLADNLDKPIELFVNNYEIQNDSSCSGIILNVSISE